MGQVDLLVGSLQPGENKKAILACNDYLRLGPGRSLAKLCRMYTEYGPGKPPTRHINSLKRWSSAYDWQARATLYDAEIERQKNEVVREIMKSGLALAHNRVNELKLLVRYLRQEVFEIDEAGEIKGFRTDNVWLPDAKGIGKGDDFERVDLVRFNAPLFGEIRAILNDLALETGGRRQRRENLNIDPSKLSDDQLDRLAAGEDLIDVILSSYGHGGDRTPPPAASQDLD